MIIADGSEILVVTVPNRFHLHPHSLFGGGNFFEDVHTKPMDGWQRGVVHSFLARRPR